MKLEKKVKWLKLRNTDRCIQEEKNISYFENLFFEMNREKKKNRKRLRFGLLLLLIANFPESDPSCSRRNLALLFFHSSPRIIPIIKIPPKFPRFDSSSELRSLLSPLLLSRGCACDRRRPGSIDPRRDGCRGGGGPDPRRRRAAAAAAAAAARGCRPRWGADAAAAVEAEAAGKDGGRRWGVQERREEAGGAVQKLNPSAEEFVPLARRGGGTARRCRRTRPCSCPPRSTSTRNTRCSSRRRSRCSPWWWAVAGARDWTPAATDPPTASRIVG